MAETNPFAKFAAPAEADTANPFAQFAPGYVAPKADGQMVSGFKRSFEEVPGLVAGVGAFAADVVGADDTRDALIGYAKRKSEALAHAHQNDAQSLTDTWDGKTGWLEFLANASGYVAGQALQGIATGGLGAIGAKMLARQGIKELAEATAAKAIAGGASEATAHAAVLEAVTAASTKSMERGAVGGAFAHNEGMELGSIYPDAVEQSEKDGKGGKLDGGDLFRVAAAASLAAGVDTAGEAIMASRVFKGSKTGAPKVDANGVIQTGPGLLGRAAREIPAGMAREAVTEAVQTGLEHYGAGSPIADDKGLKDIIDSAGVGAVGGMLGGALASRKARELPKAEDKPLPTTADATHSILGAESLDGAIAAMESAIPKTKAQTPRQAAAPDIAEIRQLDPELHDEALGLLATSQSAKASPSVRRFAANRLDELLLPVRQLSDRSLIPLGEASDLQPDETINVDTALMKFRTPAQIAADGLAEIQNARQSWPGGTIPQPEVSENEMIPTGEATVLPRQIPAGEATELEPEQIAPEALPGPASGMAPRSKSDGLLLDRATLLNAPHAVSNYLQHVQSLGTPAARAFIQDHRAGRITNDDVMSLLVPTRRKGPTPDQRLATAAAQAPKPQDIKPGDLLTADGMPYGSKVAASVRARKESGQIVPVQGGWVVRKESDLEQSELPVPAEVPAAPAADGRDQPVGSGAVVRPVAETGQAGNLQAGMPTAETSSSADFAAGTGSERDGALSTPTQTLPEKVKAKKTAVSPAVQAPSQAGVLDSAAPELAPRLMPDRADPLFEQKNTLRQVQDALDGPNAPSGNSWLKEPKLRASYERSVKELKERIAAAEATNITPPETNGIADKPRPAKPEAASADSPEAWWSNGLTPAGRREALSLVKGKPSREAVRWHYLTDEEKAKLNTLRLSGWDGTQEQPEASAPTPSANTVFTEDAADAARARLKAKLVRLQSGLDPEMMMDGITLAGYHVEKGARTFAAYARAMVDDLGDAVKPYLQSWYMAVRADPRAGSFRAGMDKASAVEDLDMDQVLAATQQPAALATLPEKVQARKEAGKEPAKMPEPAPDPSEPSTSRIDALAREFAGITNEDLQAGFDAGLTEAQIRAAIEDDFYDGNLDEATSNLQAAARAAIKRAPGAATNTVAPAAKLTRDEAVIGLRKRLSVLEALRKCLG